MPIKKFSLEPSVQDDFLEWTDEAESKLGEEHFMVEGKETPC